jgi:hypothetical protein
MSKYLRNSLYRARIGVPVALVSLLAFGALGLGSACVKKDTDARIFEKCSPDKLCAEPNICLSFTEDPKRGCCMKLCSKGSECPKGLRCTGRHQKSSGAVETYCRKPVVGHGGDCGKPGKGCKDGLRCFEGKCQQVCKTDAQCADKKTRCVPIRVDSVTPSQQKVLFSVCLVARRYLGQACADVGPFCKRGFFCYDKKCLQGCKTDAGCGKKRICDGRIYLGAGAKKRAQAKAKPDRFFCRKTAKKGRPCHHNLHLSCVRGLTCVKFHCRKVRTVGLGRKCDPDRAVYCKKGSVCFESECRRTCLSDDDCPRARGPKGTRGKELECHEKLVRKRKVMVCI